MAYAVSYSLQFSPGDCSLHGTLRIRSEPSSAGVLLQRLKLDIGEDPSDNAAIHIVASSAVVLDSCALEVAVNTAVYVVGSEIQPTAFCMRYCIVGRQKTPPIA